MNIMKHDLDKHTDEVYYRMNLGVPKAAVARHFNVTRDQLNYWLKKQGYFNQERAA